MQEKYCKDFQNLLPDLISVPLYIKYLGYSILGRTPWWCVEYLGQFQSTPGDRQANVLQ